MSDYCRCEACGGKVMSRQTRAELDNDPNSIREVIWDRGMPQESREIVRPGDANWSIGEPIGRR